MKQNVKTAGYERPAAKIKKRKLWLIPAILLLVLAVPVVAMYFADAPSRKELQSLTFQAIDFDHLRDGSYTGSFVGTKGSLRDATVEVAIANGEVSNIRILKGAIDEAGAAQEITMGKTAYDLFDEVLRQKSMQVDVISSATLTCNAHLKALENALLQAQDNY